MLPAVSTDISTGHALQRFVLLISFFKTNPSTKYLLPIFSVVVRLLNLGVNFCRLKFPAPYQSHNTIIINLISSRGKRKIIIGFSSTVTRILHFAIHSYTHIHSHPISPPPLLSHAFSRKGIVAVYRG